MKRPPPRRWSRRAKTSSNLMLTLTDDEFDEQHSECRSADCTQCTYKANRAKWHAAACFSAEPRVTWLAHKRSGCGCVACHEKYHGTAAATALADYRGQTLKWSNILRHKTTYLHRQAEAALARQTTPKAYAAPTPAEFKETWQNVRAGNAAAKLLEGKRVNERKRRAMEWCLAEAVRDLHREFLADASTMSLSWDGRHGRLVSRFSATHENTLEVRQGTLGLERDYGSGNVAMARAMEVVVERFCTVRVCRPGCHEDAEGVQPRDAARVNADPDSLAVRDEGGAGNLVEALFCHLKEITHMLVADAAPDGHLAYENLQKKRLPAQRLGSPLRPGARREAAGHAAVESGRGHPRSFRDPDSRQALLNDDSPELARAAEVAASQFGEVRHRGDNSPRSRYGHPKTQVPGKSRYHKYVKATNVFWFPVDK